jgi:hypothetical protein
MDEFPFNFDFDSTPGAWRRLSLEERDLRVVLAWIVHGKALRNVMAERDAHRPFHITALWTDARFGFALKLEGPGTPLWIVSVDAADQVSDLFYLDELGSRRSRGIRRSTEKREELRSHWLRAAQAFLVERGLLHSSPDLEPEEEGVE